MGIISLRTIRKEAKVHNAGNLSNDFSKESFTRRDFKAERLGRLLNRITNACKIFVRDSLKRRR